MDHTATFEALRRRLFGLAYRMVGLRGDAEDIVQDAYLRWHEVDRGQVRNAEAWLVATTTRLAIDRLRRLKTERDAYAGPWLPEPLLHETRPPDRDAELASDLSMAFLVLLERLGPEERAAFLLHDVFECSYPDIARILGKSETACRQTVSRARDRLRRDEKRFEATTAESHGIRRGRRTDLGRLRRGQPGQAACHKGTSIDVFAIESEEGDMTPRFDAAKYLGSALGQAMLNLSRQVETSGLERSLLELVKIRGSQINGCAYCIDMHTKDARARGESEGRIYALSAWRETPFFTPRERAALEWTEVVTRVGETGIPDAAYDAVRAEFEEAELVALTFAVIVINGWNRLAIASRAPVGTYQPQAA